jgi:hypothetical protein
MFAQNAHEANPPRAHRSTHLSPRSDQSSEAQRVDASAPLDARRGGEREAAR